jgi:hypothetical protein
MAGQFLIGERLPLLARHEGVWVGTYTFVTPSLEVLDRYDFRIRASFPEDGQGRRTYRQESDYRWSDGRTQSLAFEGALQDDAIVFDNGRIAGRMWALDERTLYLTFRYASEPEVEVCEMLQLSADGRSRARTWHWFRNERLFQLTLVDERREAG